MNKLEMEAAPSAKNPLGDQKKMAKWRAELKKNQKANEEISRINAEQARRSASKSSRTFVNSYGEATTRYVTSSTYERAQKRLKSDVERFIGRR